MNFFLKACPLCESDVEFMDFSFCQECLRDIHQKLHPRCFLMQKESLKIMSASSYEGKIAHLIRSQKKMSFYNYHSNFNQDFVNPILKHWSQEIETYKFDALIPIPSHPIRRFFYFNLSDYICDQLSKTLGIPVVSILETRHPWILEQKELSHQKRKELAKEKFVCKINDTTQKPKNALLVDDISTSGASLISCQKLLLQKNVNIRYAFVLANTPLKF